MLGEDPSGKARPTFCLPLTSGNPPQPISVKRSIVLAKTDQQNTHVALCALASRHYAHFASGVFNQPDVFVFLRPVKQHLDLTFLTEADFKQ